ncbi:hypothetical protein [Catenulispora subtropica]|uniref:PEGA domain-containing protein n=1 Tax=Catenulispora subtropica TaxID=450798 RepID=A0ABN2RHP2_9ACTN
MQGTVTIVAARPGLGRAGRMKVSVDGAVVGKVKQGTSLDLELGPGDHAVRVTGGGSRSKTVTVTVADDSHHYLDAGVHQGLLPAAGLFGAVAGYLAGVLFVLPVVLIFMVVPGWWFYLRPAPPHLAPSPLDDAEEAAATTAAATGEMWWHSDPNLAKRYRKP